MSSPTHQLESSGNQDVQGNKIEDDQSNDLEELPSDTENETDTNDNQVSESNDFDELPEVQKQLQSSDVNDKQVQRDTQIIKNSLNNCDNHNDSKIDTIQSIEDFQENDASETDFTQSSIDLNTYKQSEVSESNDQDEFLEVKVQEKIQKSEVNDKLSQILTLNNCENHDSKIDISHSNEDCQEKLANDTNFTNTEINTDKLSKDTINTDNSSTFTKCLCCTETHTGYELSEVSESNDVDKLSEANVQGQIFEVNTDKLSEDTNNTGNSSTFTESQCCNETPVCESKPEIIKTDTERKADTDSVEIPIENTDDNNPESDGSFVNESEKISNRSHSHHSELNKSALVSDSESSTEIVNQTNTNIKYKNRKDEFFSEASDPDEKDLNTDVKSAKLPEEADSNTQSPDSSSDTEKHEENISKTDVKMGSDCCKGQTNEDPEFDMSDSQPEETRINMDSESKVKGVNNKKGTARYYYGNWSERDTDQYRRGYPGKKDDRWADKNLKFYKNEITSDPDGDFIDTIHKEWKGDYRLLETHHGYIQWLFPIREKGMNWHAQELQLHEAEAIKADPKAKERVLKSYEMMLDFYGMKLLDKTTGEIGRSDNWEERSDHLNHSYHNYLRITRILKSLGELGFEGFQAPFVKFILRECFEENSLNDRILASCSNYWVGTIKNDDERNKLTYQIDKRMVENVS